MDKYQVSQFKKKYPDAMEYRCNSVVKTQVKCVNDHTIVTHISQIWGFVWIL